MPETNEFEKDSEIQNIWLTTFDNPFDPFTQFVDWLQVDELKGYQTLEKLAALSNVSVDSSDQVNDERIDKAILRLLHLNPLGNYTLAVEGKTTAWY